MLFAYREARMKCQIGVTGIACVSLWLNVFFFTKCTVCIRCGVLRSSASLFWLNTYCVSVSVWIHTYFYILLKCKIIMCWYTAFSICIFRGWLAPFPIYDLPFSYFRRCYLRGVIHLRNGVRFFSIFSDFYAIKLFFRFFFRFLTIFHFFFDVYAIFRFFLRFFDFSDFFFFPIFRFFDFFLNFSKFFRSLKISHKCVFHNASELPLGSFRFV